MLSIRNKVMEVMGRDILIKILETIKKAPGTIEGGREWFDKSDAMSDYFHTAFYIDLSLGKRDKAFVYMGGGK